MLFHKVWCVTHGWRKCGIETEIFSSGGVRAANQHVLNLNGKRIMEVGRMEVVKIENMEFHFKIIFLSAAIV